MNAPCLCDGHRPANFLPGPVTVTPEVQEALSRPPCSHRSAAFVSAFRRCKTRLCELVNADHVEILLGSGTLANDVIAGQLSLVPGPGLVLSNGEFGDRLVDHARRARLEFDTVEAPWGAPLPYDEVARRTSRRDYRWLWACHCETSTGVLNDLATLEAIGAARGALLALDCISSIGAVPVDLRGVHFASCVSGKALAAYAGLAMVFHRGVAGDGRTLPRYLDLAMYAHAPGVPYTTSTNLVAALDAALEAIAGEGSGGQPGVLARQLAGRNAAARIRCGLEGMGCRVLADERLASPAVISFEPQAGVDSLSLGEHLDASGVHLSYRSDYLLAHGTLQVCLMGAFDSTDIDALFTALNAFEACGNAARRSRRWRPSWRAGSRGQAP